MKLVTLTATIAALLSSRECMGWLTSTSNPADSCTRRRRRTVSRCFHASITNHGDHDSPSCRPESRREIDRSTSRLRQQKESLSSKNNVPAAHHLAIPLLLAATTLMAQTASAFSVAPTLSVQGTSALLQRQRQPDALSNKEDASNRQVSEATTSSRSLHQGVQTWLAASQQQQTPRPAAIDVASSSSSTTSIMPESLQPPASQEYSMLDEVWTLIDKYYIDRSYNHQDWNAVKDRFRSKLLDKSSTEPALVSEMVQTLGDKYSRVLDASAYSAIQKYDLIGVGVTLMPDPTTQLIVVGAPPIPGSASAVAGLEQGDWVTAVNGVSTLKRNAFDIINQIAEQPNAPTIDMTIVPRNHITFNGQAGGKADTATASSSSSTSAFQRTVTMPRAFAQVKNPIVYKISETRADGNKVGYIRISEFNALIKTKLEDALHDLIDNQGANALVLDIRHNGGGAFQSAVEISSLFLPDTVATYVVDQSTALIPFKTAKAEVKVPANVPVVIWLDGQSASASEVFAGSMHDNCRAVLMGEKSFGKGLIQAVYGLKNGAGLVLTVARYVTPDGVDIQGTGIQPDIAGHVSPPIPGMLSDTSGVDFSDIRQRLDPAMCQIAAVPSLAR